MALYLAVRAFLAARRHRRRMLTRRAAYAATRGAGPLMLCGACGGAGCTYCGWSGS